MSRFLKIVVFLVCLFSLYALVTWVGRNSGDKLIAELLKSEINGIVVEKVAVRESVGFTHVEIIHDMKKNSYHLGLDICNKISVGDSVFNGSFSNCLFVFHNNKKLEMTYRVLTQSFKESEIYRNDLKGVINNCD